MVETPTGLALAIVIALVQEAPLPRLATRLKLVRRQIDGEIELDGIFELLRYIYHHIGSNFRHIGRALLIARGDVGCSSTISSHNPTRIRTGTEEECGNGQSHQFLVHYVLQTSSLLLAQGPIVTACRPISYSKGGVLATSPCQALNNFLA